MKAKDLVAFGEETFRGIQQGIANVEKLARLETVTGCNIELIIQAFQDGYLELDLDTYIAWQNSRCVSPDAEKLSQSFRDLEGE